MPWIVRFADEFELEFVAFRQEIQDELLATAKLLASYGRRWRRSLESGVRF